MGSRKLHLGCGNEIRAGWVNHDGAALPGVDVVHDLTRLPWPWPDGEFERVEAFHVLEHLPATIPTMEELHRICAPGGRVLIRVPWWNSPDYVADPTHVVQFNQQTFEFFDPDSRRCQDRPYYSTARFRIVRQDYYVRLFGAYKLVRSAGAKRWLARLATHLGGIIWVMESELEAVK